MIVDDAFFMRNLLRSILEMNVYKVVAEVDNGDDAVARYRDCRPDLVLMDILMPVKNGVEATREIISFDKDALVVMCSTIGRNLLVKEACAAGASGFIVKPFTEENVTTTLQQVMSAKFTIKKEANLKKTEAVTLMES